MVYYPRYEPYYVEPQRVVVVRETSYAPAPAPVMESEASYARLGRDWAHDLRNEVATWDQFVNYLRANLVRGPSSAYAEFRSGFLAAYGVNAEAAFNASQIYTQRFDYRAANEAVSRASALNFDLVKTYQSLTSDDGVLPLVDQWIAPRSFWAALAGVRSEAFGRGARRLAELGWARVERIQATG